MKLSFSKLSPKTLTSFLCLAYIIIMFCIYPFYMKNGYEKISDAKFSFFLYCSLGAVLLLSLTGLVTILKEISKVNITDIFVLLFVIITVFSYLFSKYKEECLLGIGGWYIGLLTLILISAIYLMISKLYEYESFVLYPILGASFILFLIGILDRFSIYIIPLEVRNTAFLSTMGNINWFVGYYSVICPLGTGLLALELQKEEKRKQRILLLIYMFFTFAFGFAQGAESVLLVWLALFLGCFIFAGMKMIRLRDVFLIMALWAGSSLFIFFLRKLIINGFNYGSGGILDRMTGTPVMAIVLFVVLSLWIMIYHPSTPYSSGKIEIIEDRICKTVFIMIPALFVIWLGISVINTFLVNIPFINYDIFILNEQFGSGRGHAFKAAFMVIKEMSVKDLLIGVGPDAFMKSAYSVPQISDYLKAVWPNDLLPNAHCELLTMFINEGLLGFLSFLGIFISFLVRGIKSLKKEFNGFLMCILLSVAAYMVHNLISFTQVLNIPFLFILMGMAQAGVFDKPYSKK